MFGGLIVILWGGYIVNRLGYYHAAVFMILLLVGAGVTLESILDHDPGDLAFLLLPMSFAVALLSRKLIFILGLSYLAAPVLMFFIVPENEGVTLLKFVIPLLAIGIVLNIISRIHRDRIEELREKQLYESEMRYLLSTEAVNDGVWDWDVKKNRVYYSARWKEMIGYQPHEIGDFPEEWFSRIHPDDREHVERHVKRFGRDESPLELEYRFRHKNGDYIWVLSRGRALHDENGIVTRSLGSHTDISARKRSEEKLVFDALHDKLTGLPNRTLFNERLSRVIKRTRKDPSFLFAVLFLDLDNFKNVNDSMGHESGDELLKLFASRIQNILFDVDTLARLGGDEFALLVESLDSQQRPVEIAQRIRASLKNPFTVLDRDLYLTASIGVVIYSEEYSTSEEILRDADIAMYHAKNMGRDTVEIFNSAMRERIMRRLNLERDLRQAVARNEFYIEYQPIVDLKTSKLLAFEALLRWHHPQRGLIPPEEFIPIAEQTGLIIPIGEWVFQAACAQMKRWDRLHDYMQKVSINVNVSGKQLNRPDFPSTVTRILDATSLDPARLNIEITETVILEDNPYTFDALTSLSKLGIRFHLDDFGKGQSYLGYLQKYPLSQIKIDRSFVANLPNAKEHDLIHGIIQLAKALDMETVAEGIESKDQEAVLKYLQCDSGQGFGISVPIPADEVDKLIREQSTMAPFRFSVK